MKKQFTWIPIYKEIANKLLSYKNNRKELIEIVEELGDNYIKTISLTDRDENDEVIELEDIDPFTFMSNFNRGLKDEHRISMVEKLKEIWKLHSSLPEEFTGVPVLFIAKGWLFSYKKERNENDIDKLWQLFEEAVKAESIHDINKESFNDCLQIKGVKANITIGLYWIKPDMFIPLDNYTQNYLKNNFNITHNLNIEQILYQGYLSLIQEIKQKTSKPFYKISYNAWLAKGGEEQEGEKIEDEKKFPLNLILYGPPGTGKTFQTVNYALSIIEKKSLSDIKQEGKKDREELIRRFNYYFENDRIAFITFHQSFSYEDFIEGIKPNIVDENKEDQEDTKELRYEMKNGVFKNIAENASTYKSYIEEENQYNFELTKPQLNNVNFFKVSLGDVNLPEEAEIYEYCIQNDCISIGYGEDVDFSDCNTKQEIRDEFRKAYPDESDFHISAMERFKLWLKKDDIILIPSGIKKIRAIGQIADNNYIYDDQSGIPYNHFRKVKWLAKNIEVPVKEVYEANFQQQTIYSLKHNLIKKDFFIEENKPEKTPENHVLIIDEINRGNISKIFGELITLIEADKRKGQTNEMSTTLPYSKNKFVVPSNLYIIGTMNTADRSIALIDTALRRRFEFKEIMPDISLLEENLEGVNLQKLLETMNARIEFLLDRDHVLGHSYFMKLSSLSDLCDVFAYKIIPLLQEYFYNDWEKIRLVLADNKANENSQKFLVKKEGFEAEKLFGNNHSFDDLDDKDTYGVNLALINGTFEPEDFMKIYES